VGCAGKFDYVDRLVRGVPALEVLLRIEWSIDCLRIILKLLWKVVDQGAIYQIRNRIGAYIPGGFSGLEFEHDTEPFRCPVRAQLSLLKRVAVGNKLKQFKG
jgi:hypothetical protein